MATDCYVILCAVIYTQVRRCQQNKDGYNDIDEETMAAVSVIDDMNMNTATHDITVYIRTIYT